MNTVRYEGSDITPILNELAKKIENEQKKTSATVPCTKNDVVSRVLGVCRLQ